jgi:CubicO group peptidase (beta-lactamase class C family)
MQRHSRQEFLRYVGYGALSLQMEGKASLVPLTGGRPLPAVAPPGRNRRFSRVDEQVEMVLSGYNIPGMAVGLIRAKRLIYARGYGVQSVITRKPMTEYSVIGIASMAKMLTGAAILQLQEAGRLRLDDTFLQHVPYFRMADPRYKDITIRHILSHTSGLPEMTRDEFFRAWFDPWYDDGAAERLVRSLDGGLMLRQDPGGQQFIYSDVAYGILAALVHQVTGELFEDYQRKHILEPLQMQKTTYIKSEVKPSDLAAAHVRDADGTPIVWDHYPYARQYAPSGCLFSNIVDMSHWIMANINGGVYYNRIMRPETQAQLWVSLYNEAWGWPGVGYNSGYWVMNYAENGIGPVRMILANGCQPGIHTHATIFPDHGIAAIVLVNLQAKPGDTAFSWSICDRLAIQMLRGEL